MWCMIMTAALGISTPAPDLIVSLDHSRLSHSAAFVRAACPFARGGQYLVAEAGDPHEPAAVRVAAPEGSWYVYLTWVRHPRGARDVAVRLGGVRANVDQSVLANGQLPDNCPHDDMAQFDGRCTSGLYRLTSQPVRFAPGDTVEILRSDTLAGTVTTVESVVFSPHVYLDDLGNDSSWTGTPTINLKDYGRTASGEIGAGIAFLMPSQREVAVEWSLPTAGPCLLSANVNRGPSRAASIPLELQFADGTTQTVMLDGKSADFGRSHWQDLGVLLEPQHVRLRLKTVADACTCIDLLRLTPVGESEFVRSGEKRWESFAVEWESATDARPWLESLNVVPVNEEDIEILPLAPSGQFAHGYQVRLACSTLPVWDASDGSRFATTIGGALRFDLAHDFGFTLRSELLRDRPFVWLKDLGILVTRGTDATGSHDQIDELARRVKEAGQQPFQSTAEKYRETTGYGEERPGQDDRAFTFAYSLARPVAPRVADSLATMPEVDYSYFLSRVEDPQHRRMFLGWPNVCQEFYVLSNGAIGVSSGSGPGTGHVPAEHFTVQLGAGATPEFRDHGDPDVLQAIEDGYHIIVTTQWTVGDSAVESTALAYPLMGEEVRTGNEPLAAFVRLARKCDGKSPLWLKIRPDAWLGPDKPLKDLATARIDSSCLVAGTRPVLGFRAAQATVVAASDQEVLLKFEPDQTHVDLVIPYVAVEQALVEQALTWGFDDVVVRCKTYWDRLLTPGAVIETPDSVVNNLYKTLLPRTLVSGDLDTQGDYALKTSPIVYDAVWLHATAYGIEGLARRGHFSEARRYLEAAFRWQGSQSSDAKTYTTWKGFFNAPPRYTALLWINFHGWMQWAAARYFHFSDDRQWLEEKLPQLIESLEWTASQRQLTMHDNPNGTRPDNYGWLPPGRVTDGSAGTSTFSDCINWMGFDELTRLLEKIGHPRAAEFRAVADDYRACILRGLRHAVRRREPVRLNDGTFIPYVPGYLESEGHEETMWYAAVVDGALEGILDSGIVPPGDPLEDWVCSNLEDNLFVMAPNLADEAYFLGHGCAYLRRNQPQQAIYTFYSVIASHMSRQTLTTFEHRSWGAGRVYDLAPWPMGYYTRMLAGMLVWDEEDDTLVYGRATPRAWLDPGQQIRVERLQTRFGPTSMTLAATHDRIRGDIDLPQRSPPQSIRLQLRVNGQVTSVQLNGQPAIYDVATESVALPTGVSRVHVDAAIQRGPHP